MTDFTQHRFGFLRRWQLGRPSDTAKHRRGRKAGPSRRSRPLGRSLEHLEGRLVLSTFTVTNTSGDPTVSGSLPFEVHLANQATDEAIVQFDPSAFATHQTITLAATLTLDHAGEPKIPISIVGPAAGVTIAGGGSGSDFPVVTVTSNTQQAAIKGDSASGPITITGGNLTGASESGAGIDDFGDLVLENVAIANNHSGGGGGGVEVSGGPNIFSGNLGAALLASDTTFSGNTAAGAGGGVDMEGTAALIVNSTFSGNTAGATGGAINNGTMLIPTSIVPLNLGVVNDTISGNSAAIDGGGIDNNNGGILGILNSIVATNSIASGGTNSDLDAGGANGVYSGSSHDVIDDANGLAGSGITDGGNGNIIGHPALLAPLGDYGAANDAGVVGTGGSDLQTFALLPGSPAINDAFVLANLTANVGASDTTIQAGTQLPLPALSGSTFPYEQGKVILIGSEEMLVTGVNGNSQNGYTLTVTRGVNGTTAAVHNSGDPIFLPDERGVFAASNSIGSFQTQGFELTAKSGSTPQSAAVSTAFANGLGVSVAANDPNAPVNGGVISYTAPSGGASATLSADSATVSGGTASVNATANPTSGGYTVSASAGFGSGATFSLTNGAASAPLPTSTVTALPATETSASFTVSWSGSDAGGPGIASYSVFVSDNGGPFTAFQTDTTAASASFTGVNGHTYGFYSTATDKAGAAQPTPTAAQATTTITVSNTPLKLNEAIYVIGSGAISVSAANGVLANDTGGSGTLSVVPGAVTGAEGGTFVFHADGSFTYTPPANFPGFDYAQYTAKDTAGDTGTATVNVLSQTGGVVWKFYEQVLHRNPDYAGLQFWINDFAHGGTPGEIAAEFFESTELLTQIVEGFYEQYLGRAADPGGLEFWIAKWRQLGGPERIIASFASSPEFNALANAQYGGDANPWLEALYHRVLNRAPDPGALVFWPRQLAGGESEFQVALTFVTSPEAYGDDVTGWFFEYLGRAPTSAEQAPYVQQMLAGLTDRDIEEAITNLAEYSANPPAAPPGTGVPLPDYFAS